MSNYRHNGLDPDELERLDLIAEEWAEVIQAISKIRRHGYDSFNPNTGESNRDSLERELGDLDCVIRIAVANNDIEADVILGRSEMKSRNIVQWLHHTGVPDEVYNFYKLIP